MRASVTRALLHARPLVSRRYPPLLAIARRANSSQPPQPSPAAPSASTPPQSSTQSHLSTPQQPQQPVNIYKVFGRPFAKVFLMAMLSFQVFYWCWETMRIDEIEAEKTAEVQELEVQVAEYQAKKERKAG